MRPILSLSVLCLAALACNALSTPNPEIPLQPTSAVPSVPAPSKTPIEPTQTPAPTAVPTSEPLVLTDPIFEADIQETCETDVPILDYADGVFSIGGGSVAFMNGQLAVWCYGAKHQWIGTIEYEGYIFASDENDPMQFEIVKDEGYRFVGGVGSLTYPDDTQVELYRPTKTQEQPSASTGDQNKLIFRDNFTFNLQNGWEWQHENPSRWEITPEGWLKITGEDQSLLANGAQSNLLCRDAPSGNYQVTTHIFAEPSEDFQQATLYLYQDGENFAAVNRGYCSQCETGGNGMFMEHKVAGNWEAFNVRTQDTDVYLRLSKQDNIITGYYAFEPEDWQSLGTVQSALDISKICLGVSNVDSVGVLGDLVGEFDFLEVSKP